MTEPRRFTLEVLCHAPLLNMNHRKHWAPKNDAFQSWKWCTNLAARNAVRRIPSMSRAHVECRISFPDNRRRDVGNWAPTGKACVDGLVVAGIIPDDDDRHLVGPDMRRGPSGPQKVVLIITELEAL